MNYIEEYGTNCNAIIENRTWHEAHDRAIAKADWSTVARRDLTTLKAYLDDEAGIRFRD
ncbi:hypothetical protein [Azospirillum argentinense]|nr:hypothetical protein [Azospirillum argentinense]